MASEDEHVFNVALRKACTKENHISDMEALVWASERLITIVESSSRRIAHAHGNTYSTPRAFYVPQSRRVQATPPACLTRKFPTAALALDFSHAMLRSATISYSTRCFDSSIHPATVVNGHIKRRCGAKHDSLQRRIALSRNTVVIVRK